MKRNFRIFLLIGVLSAGTAMATPPAPAHQTHPACQGATPAAVSANFAACFYREFLNAAQTAGQIDSMVTGFADVELQMMATAYMKSGGNVAQIHALAAYYLSVPNLIRWEMAFANKPPVNAAVANVSGTKAVAYFAHPALYATHAAPGNNWPPPNPQWDMTIDEIYQEYRWQAGSTVVGALLSTIKFMNPVAKVWAYSYGAGTAIYKFATYINPDFGVELIEAANALGEADAGIPPAFLSDPTFMLAPAMPGGPQGYVENPDGSITDGYGNVTWPNTPDWEWFNFECYMTGLGCT